MSFVSADIAVVVVGYDGQPYEKVPTPSKPGFEKANYTGDHPTSKNFSVWCV